MVFNHTGMSGTLIKRSRPWTIAANFVFPPAFTLTELRIITEVTGSPPINPQATFPMPCATNSRLGGEVRCCRSSRSAALIFNKVSKDATMARVAPAVYSAGLSHCEKSGLGKNVTNSARLCATGTCTRWLGLTSQGSPSCSNHKAAPTPSNTTATGEGKSEVLSGFHLSQRTSSATDIRPMTAAPS